MNQLAVFTLFSISLLCQPLSSAADTSDTINSILAGATDIFSDPGSSLTSLKDNAEGFFNNQLGINADFDQWYRTLSVESQKAYGTVQGLIESGKAQVSKIIKLSILEDWPKLFFRRVTWKIIWEVWTLARLLTSRNISARSHPRSQGRPQLWSPSFSLSQLLCF